MNSMDKDIDHILVTEEQMKAKVAELGAQISRDYAGKDLLLVSILKGAVVFMADLMREVKIPCAIDFMVVSSYGGANTSSTGLVKIIKDLDADLTGRDVLIVEDILDDQNIPAGQVSVQILDDLDKAGGRCVGTAVAGDDHKVDSAGNFDLAHQVCHKNDRTF